MGALRAAAFGVAALLALPAGAAPDMDHLADVLKLDEVIAVMREEGLRYGESLDEDMLAGTGGEYFRDRVRAIYDAEAMSGVVRSALADQMAPEDIAATAAFFETDLGQRILTLENAARKAMSDPAVEEIARANHDDLRDSDDPRLAQVARFVEVNELVDRNVASALNSNYHFFRGFVDGGGDRLSDDEILAQVWAQETELREDTENWLFGFLLMAYRPLTEDELDAYIAFSETESGQVLNGAFFEGFDEMYRTISHALGLATSGALDGSDI
jgi:hypothetical protein